MQYVTERNGGVECLQCSLMSPLSTCRDAKLHRSAPQTPEGKKKKEIVRYAQTGKMKIDKRKKQASERVGANLAQCLLFFTPRDRALQVRKSDEKFRHSKYLKTDNIQNSARSLFYCRCLLNFLSKSPIKTGMQRFVLSKISFKKKKISNPIVNLHLGMNLP